MHEKSRGMGGDFTFTSERASDDSHHISIVFVGFGCSGSGFVIF